MLPPRHASLPPVPTRQFKLKYTAVACLSLSVAGLLLAHPQPGQRPQKPPVTQQAKDKLKLPDEQIARVSLARGTTPERLSMMPAPKLPRAVQRANLPDLPRQRASFRALQERDERGVVPPGARVRAYEQLQQLRGKFGDAKPKVGGVPALAKVNPKGVPMLTAKVSPGQWVSLGPGNIGGRVRSIVVHPTQPKTIWAASVAGGIWRTDNAGASWNPVDDFMLNLAVTSLAMNSANTAEMYAGTGEGFFNGDALRGAGVFKSGDGGLTWAQLKATEKPDFYWVNRVSVAPQGGVVLAATRGDTPGGGGLQRSEDGGKTWTRTLVGDFADVKFDPKNASRAIAGTASDGRAYFTTDSGKTWTAATQTGDPWTGRVELAYAAAVPAKDDATKTVYASVDQLGGEIWRSTDGGKTFVRRGSGENYLGQQGWYGNVIWAGDPTNADLVIVGGVDLHKSTDGGVSLVPISTWWADSQSSAHADHHVIVTHPQFGTGKNRTVYFGNDGGVYTTDDLDTVGNNAQDPRTNGWKELVNTFGVTQFFGAAGNPTSGVIVAGAQDNGTLRFDPNDGPEKFSEMFGGDGGFCAADPGDQNIFYGEYVFLNIHRSDDAGKNAKYISGQFWNDVVQQWQWKPFPFSIPDARFQRANFIAPFVLDPNDANRILAGGLDLWRTNDAKAALTNTSGPKWASLGKPSAGVPVSAIGVAAGNADLIWVGHNNGQIFTTTTGTADPPTWNRLGAPGPSPLPARYCHRIVIDPADHKRIFVCFGGYSKENLWRSLDGGQTWKDISGSLPEAPVRTLAIHPTKKEYVYIGTEVGLFASEDGGNTWSSTNEGPTNCSVDELFWMKTKLVAATHGRGLFQIDLSNP